MLKGLSKSQRLQGEQPSRLGRLFCFLEVLLEEGGDRGQDAGLGGGREPVAFAGKDGEGVGDGKAGEGGVEGAGVGEGDDGVGVAVKDKGWGEGFGGLGVVWGDEAAGDVHDGADARGVKGGESEGEEGAEGDADEGDAAGVYVGAVGDVGEGVGDGVEPERDVAAVGEECGVSALGAGAVEVVDGIDGDAESGDEGGDAVEPEVYVAACTVEEEDGGVIGVGRLGGAEADGASAGEKGGLHGVVMRGSRAATLRGMLA